MNEDEEDRQMQKPEALLVHPKIYFFAKVLFFWAIQELLSICIRKQNKITNGNKEIAMLLNVVTEISSSRFLFL